MLKTNGWVLAGLFLAIFLVLAPNALGQDPVLVKDIKVKPDSHSYPRYLTEVNGLLVFRATTIDKGYELWKTDPATGITTNLADIYPGELGSSPQIIAVVGDLLYFQATDPEVGNELWCSDGTSAGTVLCADIESTGYRHSYPTVLAELGG